MRKRLEKIIRKRFGPVYWSKKLRAQRKEIISDALDRYDEEIANGASPNEAFFTVYNGVGNLDALRKEFGVVKRRKVFLIVILSVLSVLISAPVLIWMPLLLSILSGWIVLAVYLSAFAGVLYCSWRLLTNDYYDARKLIVGTVLCGVLALLLLCYCGVLGLFELFGTEKGEPLTVNHFSYTEEIDRIESIEFIRIEGWTPTDNKPLHYAVIDKIDRTQWDACLMDLGLSRVYSEEDVWNHHMSEECFLIQLSGNEPAYVLYGERFFATIKYADDGATCMCFDAFVGSTEWQQTRRKYVNGNIR